MDVVAHAVQLEPGRALEQEAPALLGVRPAFGEQTIEGHEPRIDDERLGLALLELGARQGERVLDGEPDGAERIPAARDPGELVPGGMVPAPRRRELDPALAEASRPLVRDERRRRHGRRSSDLEPDPDVIALEEVARDAVAAHVHRPGREPDPPHRRDDGEDEPGSDGIQGA